MKTHKIKIKILLSMLIVLFLLTIATQAEETLSPEDLEAETNRILSTSISDDTITPLTETGVQPGDFTDPLVFDFTELAEGTLLGLGSPNPYQDDGVEFTARVDGPYSWGDEDQIIGNHLAARGYTELAEPFVVRVRILDPKGALRVGGYVWPDCLSGASVTAFDDGGREITSHIETDCTHTPFMGVEGTPERPIRSVEWRGLPGSDLRTFPHVDHVMIDLPTQPCSPLWEDRFPSTIIDSNNWPVVDGATIDDVGINEPSPPYSLRLNSDDSVESGIIHLPPDSTVTLTYYYQRTGGGESPDPGDDLIIEYGEEIFNFRYRWVELDTQPGSGPDMTDYESRTVPIPAEAIQEPHFKIRIRSTGDPGFDDWFVDDVKIEPLCEPPFRILGGTGYLGGGPNQFSIVELQTDPIAEIPICPNLGYYPGLDFSPDGVLYGASGELRKIVLTDGSCNAIPIGSIHSDSESSILVHSIAFHPDGTLYAINWEWIGATGYNVLYTVDDANGFATEVCRSSFASGASVWGIDFSPDGTLYGAFGALYILDPKTCEVSLSQVRRFPAHVYVSDIDFAPDGFIYGVENDTKMLYKIDPSDGSIAEQFGPYDTTLWGVASQVTRTPSVTPNSVSDPYIGVTSTLDLESSILEEEAQRAERQAAIESLKSQSQ